MMDDKIQCFLDSARGIYIPRDFAQTVKDECLFNVGEEELKVLQNGPDEELYWDVWADVLDSALLIDEQGMEWGLYQDGDLFLIRSDMTEEEFEERFL